MDTTEQSKSIFGSVRLLPTSSHPIQWILKVISGKNPLIVCLNKNPTGIKWSDEKY